MEDENLLIERNKNSKFRVTVEPVGFLFIVASVIQVIVNQFESISISLYN